MGAGLGLRWTPCAFPFVLCVCLGRARGFTNKVVWQLWRLKPFTKSGPFSGPQFQESHRSAGTGAPPQSVRGSPSRKRTCVIMWGSLSAQAWMLPLLWAGQCPSDCWDGGAGGEAGSPGFGEGTGGLQMGGLVSLAWPYLTLYQTFHWPSVDPFMDPAERGTVQAVRQTMLADRQEPLCLTSKVTS